MESMKLTLSNSRQIVTMTLLWTTALFAVDYLKHPRPLALLFGIKREGVGCAVRSTKPTILLKVNHLCCSGCLDDLQAALQPLTWVDKVELDKSALMVGNQHEQTLDDFSNSVRIEIKDKDIPRMDFIALDRAMRDAGFVAARIEFSGIPHMRLEAHVTHLCCNLCQMALEKGVKIAIRPGADSTFKWLDTINVDRPQKTVTVYTRYDAIVDVGEFIAALNQLGFAPATLMVSR
jgi:hypothetical protein